MAHPLQTGRDNSTGQERLKRRLVHRAFQFIIEASLGGLKQRVLLGASVSIVLHGLILALLPGVTLRAPAKPRGLEVRLSARLVPTPSTPAPALRQPASRQPSTRRQLRALPTRATSVSAAGNPEVLLSPAQPELAAPVPEPSLAERARAGLQAADRELQAAAQAHPNGQLLALPAPHRNLQSLPPALQTALARSFEQELAELVVLGRSESQQGNERITRIRTNKGTYCVREYLIKPHYLRDAPTVPRVGSCGP